MKREIYKQLLIWKNSKKRKPLILKGARQIGKTHILKSFAENEFEGFHYFNFEEDSRLSSFFNDDLDPERIIKNISLYKEKKINLKKDILILDEIQACPRALTSLKYFYEKIPELAVTAAGSLLGVTLNEFSFPVGKVDTLEMYPMSFREFLLALSKKDIVNFLDKVKNEIPEPIQEKLWDIFKIYLIVGGLPEVVLEYVENKNKPETVFKLVRDKQNQLINDYMADMAKHSGKENSLHLTKIWTHIPLHLARDINGSATKFQFKGIIPEKNRYSRLAGAIDWLDATGLIIKIPILEKADLPLKAYTKENSFKLMIFDVGILGALSKISPLTILDYDYGSYKGYYAENFVAMELLNFQGNDKTLYSWKENQSEIEFLKEKDGKLYPIEVKSGHITKSKSLYSFSQRYKNIGFKTILSARNIKIDELNNLRKYPLYYVSWVLKNIF